MSHRPAVILVVVLLAAACGGEAPPGAPAPHEDLPRVLARVEALLPHLRAELGEDAIRDDPVAVLDRKEFGQRLAAEASYPEAVLGRSTEGRLAAGARFYLLFFSDVVTDQGVLLLSSVPDKDADLDARLIHGLVTGEWARRHDLRAFRRTPATYEEIYARQFALAALVRHVGREVAARAGIEDAYERVARVGLRRFAPGEVDCELAYAFFVSRAADDFWVSAADRFVARLIDHHGLAGAGERIFARPPTTSGTLLNPDGRLVETPRRETGEAVRSALSRELICEPLKPIVSPQIEALLVFTDAAKRREAVNTFLTGFEFWAKPTKEENPDSVRIRIVIARAPKGAEAILAGWIDSTRQLDERWKKARSRHRSRASARSRESGAGVLFERTIDDGYRHRWDRPEQLIFREGEIVVEVRCKHLWDLDTDAEALARRIRSALRCVGAGPVTPEDDRSDAWEKRWRALLEIGTTPDARDVDALRAAAEDPDRDVRRAAYRGLVRLGLLTEKRRAIAAADPSWEIRWLAVLHRINDESIGKRERANLLVPLFADADPRVRLRACHRSDDLVPGGSAVPWAALRPLLSDPNAAVRAAAYDCWMEYRMPPAVRNGSLTVEEFRFRDLEEGEGPPPEVAAALLAGVRDPDAEVRILAVSALGALGPRHPELAAVLRRALADECRSVREATLSSLAMGIDVPDGLADAIEPFLDDEDEFVREYAKKATAHGTD